MVDLHTHILPGVDDGARTVQDSLTMLFAQYAQGVDTVVLTPHYYPDREESSAFLLRRNAAWQQLNEAIEALSAEEKAQLPALILGAEVAYIPGLQNVSDLEQLCIGNTKNMLLELPFYLWDMQMVHGLYSFLEQAGVTPILAHVERYIPCQRRKMLDAVLELGLPVQVGTDLMSMAFSPVLRLLKQGRGHLVASDCHDLSHRPPNLAQAMDVVKKKLGHERFEELDDLAIQLTEIE